MRLVRDDDVELMDEEQQEQKPPGADPRDSRFPSEQASGEQGVGEQAPGEQPDGVVDDSVDDSADDSPEAADVQVDLRTLEALLFSTHHPLTAGRLAEMLELESTKPVRRAIKELNEQYVTSDRSYRIEQVAGGYQMLTLPDFGEILKRLHQREVDAKLTKAALET